MPYPNYLRRHFHVPKKKSQKTKVRTLMHTAELTTASKDAKRQPITQSAVSSTTQPEATSTQPRGKQPKSRVLCLIIVNNDTTDGGHYTTVKMPAKKRMIKLASPSSHTFC